MGDRTGRVLALDLGEVRIGVAMSDPLGITANPREPLMSAGVRKDLERLVDLVREYGVVTVVVGLPLLLSGEEGQGAEGLPPGYVDASATSTSNCGMSA